MHLNVRQIWQCTVCKKLFPTEAEATACASSDEPYPNCAPGDIVVMKNAKEHGRFGWFDGDEKWVYCKAPGRHSTTADCFSFYYVVTAIDRVDNEPHRWRIHLVTEAMKTGYENGWTSSHHMSFVKLKEPPEEIRVAGIKHIGRLAKHLL